MNVLAIGAHPDDIEIGCGGALAFLKSKGANVFGVIATGGEAGATHGNSDQLKQTRRQEAENGAQVLKMSELHFLDLPDGLTAFSPKDKVQLIGLIRKIKPDIVFVHATQDHYPDHKIVNELSLSALRGAAAQAYGETGLDPHDVSCIYGYEVWHPLNTWQMVLDITDFMSVKQKAIQCHVSQLVDINYAQAIEGLAIYRAGLNQKGKYAEAYEVIKAEIPEGF